MKRILVLFLVGLFFIGCSVNTSQQIVSWEDWKENVDSIPLNEKEVIGTIKYRYIFKGEKFNGIVLQPIVYIDGSPNFGRSEYIDGLIYKESYKYNGHDFLIKWDSVKKTIQQNTYQFYDNGKVWFKNEEYLSKQFLDSISINPTFFPEDNQDLYFVKHGVNEIYYENGQLESTKEYRDGKEIGNHKYYHENGQLKSSLSYDNNGKVVDGTYKSYYVNGDLNYESNFKNGLLHGLQTWYKDGKIYEQTLVENGDVKYFIFENFRSLRTGKISFEKSKEFMVERCRNINQQLIKSFVSNFDGNDVYMFFTLSTDRPGYSCVSLMTPFKLEILSTDCNLNEVKVKEWNNIPGSPKIYL